MHQVWRDGRNIIRRVLASEAAQLREGIDNAKGSAELPSELARINIARTLPRFRRFRSRLQNRCRSPTQAVQCRKDPDSMRLGPRSKLSWRLEKTPNHPCQTRTQGPMLEKLKPQNGGMAVFARSLPIGTKEHPDAHGRDACASLEKSKSKVTWV